MSINKIPKKRNRAEIEKLLRFILKWENKQPIEAIANGIEAACEQTIKHKDEITLKHIFDEFSVYCPEASKEKDNFLRAIQLGRVESILLVLINDVQESLLELLNTLPETATEPDLELDGEIRALACLTKHPSWSKAKIAREIGVNRTTIYEYPLFKMAVELLKESKQDMPHGFKDGKSGDIDSWEP